MRNYLAALETRKKRVSPKAISLRLLYNTLGETCINLGHDSEAYRYFQKTAGILRLHDCQFITDEIPMLLFLARHDKSKRIQHSLNGIPRPLSLNYLKEVLKLAKAEIPADNMLLAETSYEIAEVYKGSGDYVSSEKLHQKALDLRLSVKQKDKLAIIQSLEALGRMHRDRKDYEKALLYFNRALIIKESLLKDDDVSLASSYMAIGKLECGVDRGIKGWFQSSKTNLKKAEELLKKAIVIYRRQGSDDVKELIEAYDSLKQVYLSTGRNSEADILSVEAKRALQQSSNSRQGF